MGPEYPGLALAVVYLGLALALVLVRLASALARVGWAWGQAYFVATLLQRAWILFRSQLWVVKLPRERRK